MGLDGLLSTGGAWLSSSRTPLWGAIRPDIGTVTFGDPLRAVPAPGSLVAARYDSGVNDGSDLWNGWLVHIPDDGGDPRVLLDFATDLPGAARSPAASLMAPVPLWDGCPDGRIAVLDPVARKLFMVDPARNERAAVTLPWHPEPSGTDACIAYMMSMARAETARGSVSEAELTRLATEAAADAGGLQRLATVLVPPFARSTLTPSPPTIPATSPAWPTNRGDLKP